MQQEVSTLHVFRLRCKSADPASCSSKCMSDVWFEQTDKTFRFSSRGHSGESWGDRQAVTAASNRTATAVASDEFLQAIVTLLSFTLLLRMAGLHWYHAVSCATRAAEGVWWHLSPALYREAREPLQPHTYLLFSLYLHFGIPALRRERMCAHVELLSEAPLTCILGQVGGMNFWIMWPEANISTEGGKVHLWFLFV